MISECPSSAGVRRSLGAGMLIGRLIATFLSLLILLLAVLLCDSAPANASPPTLHLLLGSRRPSELEEVPRLVARRTDALYLEMCTQRYGCALWRSDGTRRGTRIVVDSLSRKPSSDSPGDTVVASIGQLRAPQPGRGLAGAALASLPLPGKLSSLRFAGFGPPPFNGYIVFLAGDFAPDDSWYPWVWVVGANAVTARRARLVLPDGQLADVDMSRLGPLGFESTPRVAWNRSEMLVASDFLAPGDQATSHVLRVDSETGVLRIIRFEPPLSDDGTDGFSDLLGVPEGTFVVSDYGQRLWWVPAGSDRGELLRTPGELSDLSILAYWRGHLLLGATRDQASELVDFDRAARTFRSVPGSNLGAKQSKFCGQVFGAEGPWVYMAICSTPNTGPTVVVGRYNVVTGLYERLARVAKVCGDRDLPLSDNEIIASQRDVMLLEVGACVANQTRAPVLPADRDSWGGFLYLLHKPTGRLVAMRSLRGRRLTVCGKVTPLPRRRFALLAAEEPNVACDLWIASSRSGRAIPASRALRAWRIQRPVLLDSVRGVAYLRGKTAENRALVVALDFAKRRVKQLYISRSKVYEYGGRYSIDADDALAGVKRGPYIYFTDVLDGELYLWRINTRRNTARAVARLHIGSGTVVEAAYKVGRSYILAIADGITDTVHMAVARGL